MPMDEYDTCHTTHYEHVINIRSKNNIDDIVDNAINMDQIENIKKPTLKTEIINTINKLRGALDVLDCRTITCISARVAHTKYCNITNGVKIIWFLVNVWRGSF